MKNTLKKVVVPLLASRPVTAIATRLFGTGLPVFMLHRVISDGGQGRGHTTSYLRACLRYLGESGYNFVSLEDILASLRGEISLPPKPVAFTMDDGFHDQARLAAPIFIEFNCPVTIFLITGMIDGHSWPWFSMVNYLIDTTRVDSIDLDTPKGKHVYRLGSRVERIQAARTIQDAMKSMDSDSLHECLDRLVAATQTDIPATPPAEYKPITWDMARTLEQQGINFGPHSITHRILSRLDDQASQKEISGSWQRLEEELSSPCKVFCYPTGRQSDFGSREIEIIRNNGFLGAVSAVPAYVETTPTGREYIFSLPRFALPESMEDFIQYCTWIEYAKQKHRNC